MQPSREHVLTWLFTCAGVMSASLRAWPAQVSKTIVMQFQANLFPMAPCKQTVKVELLPKNNVRTTQNALGLLEQTLSAPDSGSP